MVKRTLGTTETVDQDLADAVQLEWVFQSDTAFLSSVGNLLPDAVGPVAQVRNLRGLQDNVEVWGRFLALLSEEIAEAREFEQAQLLPDMEALKEMMAAARRSLWDEKRQPAEVHMSPVILKQIGDQE